MASRSEAQEHKTTKCPKFQSVPQGHHIGAPWEAPFHAGASPHFTCVSIFHTIKDRISLRSHTRPTAEFHCAASPPHRAPFSRCVHSLCVLYLPCASAKFSVFCQIFLHSLCRYDILIMCNMLLLGFVPCFMPSSRCCGEKAQAMMLRQQFDQSTRWPAIIK